MLYKSLHKYCYHIINYFLIRQRLKFLLVYHFEKKIRLGSNKDGGYVIGDLTGGYDCYISAGVGDEESFSVAFLEKYCISPKNSFAFDGTIQHYPSSFKNNITFYKKNIGSYNDQQHTNLIEIIQNFDNIFLKMDIEGGEFEWLNSLDDKVLSKFKQIVIEIHGAVNFDRSIRNSAKNLSLKKLSLTHYIIHAHSNNNSPILYRIPDIIELTYVNKKYFTIKPKQNQLSFPIEGLDFPNNPELTDIHLNFYPFVVL